MSETKYPEKPEELAKWIRGTREALEMTQRDLAAESDVSYSYVAKLELGQVPEEVSKGMRSVAEVLRRRLDGEPGGGNPVRDIQLLSEILTKISKLPNKQRKILIDLIS